MKRNSGKRFGFFRNFSLFFLLVLSISNCKQKVEGCLDIEATNFAFSADESCPDDCCTYPNLTFEIAFRWDTLSLIYGNPYNLVDSTTVIKIMKTKFYISDISLTNDNDSLMVLDRIELMVNDGSSGYETFVDDFTLMSRDFTSFNYEIGEIRGLGSFDSLRFFVGLSDLANKVEPSSAPDGHPLSIQGDSMWSVEDAYVFNKLIMLPDTMTMPPTDTLTFNITDIAGDRVEVVLPFKYELEVGTDIQVRIIVDYFKWFQGIDFEDIPTEVVINNIVDNTIKAFSINE